MDAKLRLVRVKRKRDTAAAEDLGVDNIGGFALEALFVRVCVWEEGGMKDCICPVRCAFSNDCLTYTR